MFVLDLSFFFDIRFIYMQKVKQAIVYDNTIKWKASTKKWKIKNNDEYIIHKLATFSVENFFFIRFNWFLNIDFLWINSINENRYWCVIVVVIVVFVFNLVYLHIADCCWHTAKSAESTNRIKTDFVYFCRVRRDKSSRRIVGAIQKVSFWKMTFVTSHFCCWFLYLIWHSVGLSD